MLTAGGARPSHERPATGQEMNQMLGPGFTSHGIPKLVDNEGNHIDLGHDKFRGFYPSRKVYFDSILAFYCSATVIIMK